MLGRLQWSARGRSKPERDSLYGLPVLRVDAGLDGFWGRGRLCRAGRGLLRQGVRRVLDCDIALSSTGVAGPDRDDRDNEVGTMFVAIATPEGTHVRALHLGARPMRERLRIQTASHAFDLARRYLAGLDYGH